ncbi:hypothetical protein ACJJTC_015352 [Scirpophaga incertulas]
MGGCRCTYRTCSIKTDGKTHMFHYPVFEKNRCHQWIINARRFDFFNLTVSQVRNRVICQHHFKDDCFMNYKKDKLTFNAIPTIDGPFCDSSNEDKSKLQAALEDYSFIVVENQISHIDKKACHSLKYMDFLSHIHEPWEQDSYIVLPPPIKQTLNRQIDLLPLTKNKQLLTNENETVSITKEIPQQNQSLNSNETQPCISYVPVTNTAPTDSHNSLSSNVLNIISDGLNNFNINLNSNLLNVPPAENTKYSSLEQPLGVGPPYAADTVNNLNEQTVPNTAQTIQDSKYYFHFDQAQKDPETPAPKNKQKIKILSEKRISDPLPFVGKLEPVPPSLVLCVPERYKKENIRQTQEAKVIQDKNASTGSQIIPNITTKEYKSVKIKSNQENDDSQVKIEIEVTPQEVELQSKRKSPLDVSSLLKRNLPPERIAAIEQKRNFNKKLRDIYETCLGSTEKLNTTNVPNTEDTKESAVSPKSVALNNILGFNAMDYLDARMTKMENILAKKIEQNTKRILDLKNCVTPRKNVSIHTQTNPSEESYKKYLYQELSKFLSPNTNSLVYEELFIDKYGQKVVNIGNSVKKRRKNR